jgi:hypothetical protein
MRFSLLAAVALLAPVNLHAAPVLAPPAAALASDVQTFVRVPGGRTAITHVRVIDGTGAAPMDDETILIDGARITAVQPASASVPPG